MDEKPTELMRFKPFPTKLMWFHMMFPQPVVLAQMPRQGPNWIERCVSRTFYGVVWAVRRAKCSLAHHDPAGAWDGQRLVIHCEQCGKTLDKNYK